MNEKAEIRRQEFKGHATTAMLNQGSGGLDVKPVPAKNLAQFDAKQEVETITETETISEEEIARTDDDPQSSSTETDASTEV